VPVRVSRPRRVACPRRVLFPDGAFPAGEVPPQGGRAEGVETCQFVLYVSPSSLFLFLTWRVLRQERKAGRVRSLPVLDDMDFSYEYIRQNS